jgi:hypothetical protein
VLCVVAMDGYFEYCWNGCGFVVVKVLTRWLRYTIRQAISSIVLESCCCMPKLNHFKFLVLCDVQLEWCIISHKCKLLFKFDSVTYDSTPLVPSVSLIVASLIHC